MPNAATPVDMRVVDIIVIVFAVNDMVAPIAVNMIDTISDMIEAIFLATFSLHICYDCHHRCAVVNIHCTTGIVFGNCHEKHCQKCECNY